jgi:hypothetical protein
MIKQKQKPLLEVFSNITQIGVTIKTKHNRTKFKLRCPRYLYTLKIDDQGRADKIKSSIPTSKAIFY